MQFRDSNRKLRILIIGTLPPPTGGTTVSLEHLVKYLMADQDINLFMADTGGAHGQGLKGFARLAKLPFSLLNALLKADVVTYHCSDSGLSIRGIGALFLSRLFRKPFIIRKFGGNDYRLARRSRLCEYVINHSNLFLAETHQVVALAKERGVDHVRWFPTHRPFPESDATAQPFSPACRRFVYVGHVRENKGMHVLKEAARQLPNGVTIDVFGPWFDDLEKNFFDDSANISYSGALKPQDVIPTLRQYDALLFPTLCHTEGYPGSVLEAYIAGLPVISSRIGAIPEILDESVGILIEPGNPDELAKAIIRLHQDKELFQRLRANTPKKAKFLSVERWAKTFIEHCQKLASPGR